MSDEKIVIGYQREFCVVNRAGCKENHFYSLPFGQAEANIY